MELRCQYDLHSDGYIFRLRDDLSPDWKIATRIEFETVERYSYTQPSFRLERHEAQALMDELWSQGLRPTQGKQSEGMFDAQGRHLEDMRTIAFAKLNINQGNT